MGRPKKYHTEAERKAAALEYSRKYEAKRKAKRQAEKEARHA